jgi:hypothetical protein
MDVDEDDEIHLEMVGENKGVENQCYPNLMMILEYSLDLELMRHEENYLIDPIILLNIT